MSQPSSSSTPTPERQDQQKPPNQATPNTPQPPSSIPKKIAPLPWSHLETVNLIDAYQHKWYSLKRGQLKASQWEEVALSVASRCGFKELSKSATQCRHKMEKLRKRYRGEKQRGSPSVWTYFDMMDMMERGPFPISARPVSLLPPSSSSHHHHIRHPHPIQPSSSDDDYEDDNVEGDDDQSNKSRSINHILSRRPVTSPIFDALPLPSKYGGSGNGGGNGGRGVEGMVGAKFLRDPRFQKRKREVEIDEVDDDEEEDEVEEAVEVEEEQDVGGRLLSELASAVRAFGEGFIRIENMKLEMMREAERHRLEMEKKRMELIQESQQRIVDVIAKTFDSHKKSKNQET